MSIQWAAQGCVSTVAYAADPSRCHGLVDAARGSSIAAMGLLGVLACGPLALEPEAEREYEEACLRGVCMPSCGLDLAAFDDDLAPELRPVWHVCAELEEGPLAVAVGSEPDAFRFFHVHESPNNRFAFQLDRYEVALGEAELSVAGEPCSTSFTPRLHARPHPPVMLSRALALSPGGTFASFGVRANNDADGSAFLVDDECRVEDVPFRNYTSAVLLSDGPEHWFVKGVADEPGSIAAIYRRGTELAAIVGDDDDDDDGLGVYGSVARYGDSIVTTMQYGLAFYPLAQFRDGPHPVRGVSAHQYGPIDWFTALEGRGLVTWGPRQSVSPFDLFVPEELAGTPVDGIFASSRFDDVVAITGSRGVALRHPGGVMIFE